VNDNRCTHTRQGLAAPRRRLARALASALGLSAALNWPATALAGNTFIVNTTGDPGSPGTLSLRQAVAAADVANGNTVQFDPSLSGSSITLTTGTIYLTHSMNILGPGAARLTISGGDLGGIFSANCPGTETVEISSLTLAHGNRANAYSGGALFSSNCSLDLHDAVVTASHAGRGGCISFNNGVIRDSVVSGCSADKTGGGIQVETGPRDTNIITSTVTSNTAGDAGGGVSVRNLKADLGRGANIYRSTINKNSVTAHDASGGGGIYAGTSTLSLGYSTVANNTSYTAGGGIMLADAYSASHSTVFRSTVAHNSAQKTSGNGIYAVGATASVIYSIVAGNFNKYGLTDLSGSFTVTQSLVQSPDSATIGGSGSLLGVDPNLGALGINGGRTPTMLPNSGSPALDAITECLFIDQRGVPGCVNAKSDMGAVERQNPEVMIFRDAFESE
jgi:hypothetical protein